MTKSAAPLVVVEVVDGIAVIALCRPPANALGLDLRRALHSALGSAAGNHAVRAVILSGAGGGFSAGGDRREIQTGEVLDWPRLTLDIHPVIEQMAKPVVAAAHGYAVGGGLETMLACHFRVSCADTQIALPEIAAGIVPLSATQRLPRLLTMTDAIDLILSARKRPASDFAHTALFDRIVGARNVAALRAAAMDVAHRALQEGPPYPSVRQRSCVDGAEAIPIIAGARQGLSATPDVFLREAALDALAAAAGEPSFDEGMRIATGICERVLAGRRTPA
jgi:enoyl-CoA hydratase